ncbi:hypothetical protein Tco_0054356 [Tanacetum coccineum]
MDGFASHPLPQPEGNINGWLIEDDDEELEEDGVDEELEEDGVGDGEEEEMEIDDEMDDSKVINLDEIEEGELPPPIPIVHEPEAEAAIVGTGRLVPLTGRRLFTNTQVCMGSSSSAATGYDPKDLTLSHIRSDLNALHHRTPTTTSAFQEVPYVPPTALVVPVAHNDPRDLYVATRDAATVPAIDDNDTSAHEETSLSETQGFPPRDSW